MFDVRDWNHNPLYERIAIVKEHSPDSEWIYDLEYDIKAEHWIAISLR